MCCAVITSHMLPFGRSEARLSGCVTGGRAEFLMCFAGGHELQVNHLFGWLLGATQVPAASCCLTSLLHMHPYHRVVLHVLIFLAAGLAQDLLLNSKSETAGRQFQSHFAQGSTPVLLVDPSLTQLSAPPNVDVVALEFILTNANDEAIIDTSSEGLSISANSSLFDVGVFENVVVVAAAGSPPRLLDLTDWKDALVSASYYNFQDYATSSVRHVSIQVTFSNSVVRIGHVQIFLDPAPRSTTTIQSIAVQATPTPTTGSSTHGTTSSSTIPATQITSSTSSDSVLVYA